jgi:hypothetical protein
MPIPEFGISVSFGESMATLGYRITLSKVVHDGERGVEGLT